MARTSEMKDLRRQLVEQGFHVCQMKSGHWQVIAPDGQKCQIASTPRQHRGVLNAVTRLKRIGFCPKKK